MNDALVVVESPAKAKTINRYLGNNYKVVASNGHVRDLLPKSGAVEPDKDFHMHYEIIQKNAKSVQAICDALEKSNTLILATDPDREGEAPEGRGYGGDEGARPGGRHAALDPEG